MIRAVIFDIDGTLIDSNDLHAAAWVEALGHFGVVVPYPVMRHQIGKGGDQLLPVFLSPERVERDAEEISTFRAELFRRSYLPHIRPFPEVPALFEKLRQTGHKIALASSGKAEEVKTYARLAGIADLIDVSVSADDAEHSKPKPDIFQATLAKLDPIPASECVVIGDTPYDGVAAGEAGIRWIGVLCGGFPEAELRPAGATAIYRDPADLLARLAVSPLWPAA